MLRRFVLERCRRTVAVPDHALPREQVKHSHDNWLMEADTTLASEIRALLDELCVESGFCLPAHIREELISAPPEDVDAFTDAVFAGEGLDASLYKQLRRAVRNKIERRIGVLLLVGR
jgi:hypothetical protein